MTRCLPSFTRLGSLSPPCYRNAADSLYSTSAHPGYRKSSDVSIDHRYHRHTRTIESLSTIFSAIPSYRMNMRGPYRAFCLLDTLAGTLHRRRGVPEGRSQGSPTRPRLLRELAQNGMLVKIADLDTQQATCTAWASDRAEAGIKPEILVQPFGPAPATPVDPVGRGAGASFNPSILQCGPARAGSDLRAPGRKHV